ncbi:MAG: hypothetical protein WC759_04255 [Candidatus Micrarchaeia archaeon]|jgi:hypothetical protein
MAPKIITFQKPGVQPAAAQLPTIRDVAGRYHGRDPDNALHLEMHDALVAVVAKGKEGMPKVELVRELRSEYRRYGVARDFGMQQKFVELLATEKGYIEEDGNGNLKITAEGRSALERLAKGV